MDFRQAPSPAGAHWLLGHVPLIQEDPIAFTARVAQENDPLVALRFFNRRIYITANAETARKVLISESDKFNKGPNYKNLSLLGGNGLITSEGEFWKRQRRLAQPGFHRERIQQFCQSFIHLAEEVRQRWLAIPEDTSVRMAAEMSQYTLKAVGWTLFSMDLVADSKQVPTYLKDTLRFLNIRNYQLIRWPIKWPIPANRRFQKKLSELDRVVYGIIRRRLDSGEAKEDLLDMFLQSTDAETGEKMSEQHIRDEIATMFAAGFETTSVALTWTWYLLYRHPEIRQKALEEIRAVQNGADLTAEMLPKMEYLLQVVQESMRLYPPVFTIPRGVPEACELEGFKLKKKSRVLISIYGLHRHPRYWENPEKFDPDRFAKGRLTAEQKSAFMPFGTGQRICIGQQFAMVEMTALLAVLLPHFTPEIPAGYVPEMIPSITTSVKGDMPMFLKRSQV